MLTAGPADLVRLPRDPRATLVFYRLICPGCDWSTLVSREAGGIEEAGGSVSFSRGIRCDRCGELIRVLECSIGGTGHARSCCRR